MGDGQRQWPQSEKDVVTSSDTSGMKAQVTSPIKSPSPAAVLLWVRGLKQSEEDGPVKPGREVGTVACPIKQPKSWSM